MSGSIEHAIESGAGCANGGQMSDSEVPEEPSHRTRARTRARIMFSELVPDGRTMVEVERDTETVICVRPGEMSPALADEWNAHLAHATRSGRWLRAETSERPEGHPPV